MTDEIEKLGVVVGRAYAKYGRHSKMEEKLHDCSLEEYVSKALLQALIDMPIGDLPELTDMDKSRLANGFMGRAELFRYLLKEILNYD